MKASVFVAGIAALAACSSGESFEAMAVPVITDEARAAQPCAFHPADFSDNCPAGTTCMFLDDALLCLPEPICGASMICPEEYTCAVFLSLPPRLAGCAPR